MPAANGAKGNPASKRMMNASKKAKRVKNKARNERVAATTSVPVKSAKAFRNWMKHNVPRSRGEHVS